MNIKIPRQEFAGALGDLAGSLPRVSILPALEGYLFDFSEHIVEVTASNGQMTTNFKLWYGSEQPGKVVIPAKLLSIVKSMSSEEITLKVDPEKNVAEIKGGTAKFMLNCTTAEDYPQEPLGDLPNMVKLETTKFKEALKNVTFAVSKDIARIAFSGVVFTKDKLISSDTYRLAFADLELGEEEVSLLVPLNAVQLANRIIDGMYTTIFWDESSIRFANEICQISTRLIEARFPDVSGVIPEGCKTKVPNLPFESFSASLQRAALLAPGDKQAVTLTLQEPETGKSFTVSVRGEYGEMEETLEAEWEGEPVQVICNAKYLLEALKNVPDNVEVAFELNGDGGPMIFRWPGYYYLALPIKKLT